MKWIQSLTVAVFALGLLAGQNAWALSCCSKAILFGKKCAHPCCVEAAKDHKACEKCNETCCDKATAAGKRCAHPCCVEAAKKGVGCEKCKTTCCDTALFVDEKGEVKKCAHPCCVAAFKEGKICEKCNPPKKDKKT